MENLKHLLAITGGLFIFILVLGAAKQERERKEVQNTQPLFNIQAEQLLEEYKANDVVADTKYKEKVIQISGIVKNIKKDLFDDIYVVLAESGTRSVHCFLDNKEDVAKISIGNNIILKGRCEGKNIDVELKYCLLIPSE